MEATISKNASQLAGETIVTFKEVNRKRKAEKAYAKKMSGSDAIRNGIMAAVIVSLLAVYFCQRMFF